MPLLALHRRFVLGNDKMATAPDLSLRGRPAPVAISGRHCRFAQAVDKSVPTDCVCSGAHCAAVGGFAALRMRSERRYRRNWCIPFSRRPVRIGSIAPSEACPSPTTRKQLPCTTPDFRQNVFDISGAGGYNKDVETQTVATNITYLFPICELDHSQISESSGCDRRLTFFLSEANRRSGRRGNRLRREEKSERKPSGCPFAFNNPPQRKIAK